MGIIFKNKQIFDNKGFFFCEQWCRSVKKQPTCIGQRNKKTIVFKNDKKKFTEQSIFFDKLLNTETTILL